MRFTVGKKYTFVVTGQTPKEGVDTFFNHIFIPWDHNLDYMLFEEIECIEHQKVRGGHDNDLIYDGFAFMDKNKRIWYNQMPVATYGQMDTSFDWKAHMSFVDARDVALVEPEKNLVDEMERRGFKFSGQSKHYQGKLYEVTRLLDWTLVTAFMDNILLGIYNQKLSTDPKEDALYKHDLFEWLMQVETASPEKHFFMPFAFEKSVKDGETTENIIWHMVHSVAESDVSPEDKERFAHFDRAVREGFVDTVLTPLPTGFL